MKKCGQEETIKLNVFGEEKTFSKKDVETAMEDYLSKEAIMRNKENVQLEKPTEGKWFRVNPLKIDQEFFKEPREDGSQEKTRQIILSAFRKLNSNPDYYGIPFETMMPEKTWVLKKIADMRDMAMDLGERTANLYEQSLEWAQRIINESWEAICNDSDTAKCYRFVENSDKSVLIVGGCENSKPIAHPSDIANFGKYSAEIMNTVPLVVRHIVGNQK